MGLTLINNTNLSYFPNEQKAAVFKLQGMLFEAMDDSEQAAQLYFTSLHIKEDAQSWLMWGKLCASKGERTANDIAKTRNLGEQSKTMVRSYTKILLKSNITFVYYVIFRNGWMHVCPSGF